MNDAAVVLVNNMSIEPFRLLHPQFARSVISAPPSRAWTLALQGAADVVVMPVARRHEVSRMFEPLGDFGVACHGAVRSVVVLGQAPIVQLVEQGSPIYATTQSETSRQLLRVLCRRVVGLDPNLTTALSEARGHLCIGDDALRRQLDPSGWPVVVDLGSWWKDQTGLPFVFARWMIRRSVPEAMRRAALTWLEECAVLAETKLGQLTMVQRAMNANLFKHASDALAYFGGLHCRFDDNDRQAELLFLQELDRLRAS